MTHNLELVRGLYAAFGRGDIAAVMAALAPQLEWTEAEGFPSGGTYTTPGAVLDQVFMRLAADWEHFGAEAREYVSEGDRVVAIGRYTGTGKATRKSFEAPFAHLWTVRDGKVVGFRQYTDTAVVQRALDAG